MAESKKRKAKSEKKAIRAAATSRLGDTEKILSTQSISAKQTIAPSASEAGALKKGAHVENLSTLQRLKSDFDARLCLALVALALTLAFMAAPALRRAPQIYEADTIASRDIAAVDEMLIVDKIATERKRAGLIASSPEVYFLDPAVIERSRSRMLEALAKVTEFYERRLGDEYDRFNLALANERPDAAFLARLNDLAATDRFRQIERDFYQSARFSPSIDSRDRATARSYGYAPIIFQGAALVAESIMSRGALESKPDRSGSEPGGGILVEYLDSGDELGLFDLGMIYDLDEAREAARMSAESFGEIVPALRPLVGALASRLIEPNMSYSARETAARAQALGASSETVYLKLKRGEMIVRAGDRVSAAQEAKLTAMADAIKSEGRARIYIGFFLLNIFMLALAPPILGKIRPSLWASRPLMLLLAILVVGHMALIWIAIKWGASIFMVGLDFETNYIALSAPFIAAPLIVSIFFSADVTILFTIFVAALSAAQFGISNIIVALTFVSGALCAYSAESFRSRVELLKRGALIGAINGALVFIYQTMINALSISDGLDSVALVFIGAGLSVALVSALIPLIEHFFPVVSDIKLIETSTTDHPVLKRLLMDAPGTYHHSMMVGYLAEEAAAAIGANPLLARAGAMFHDIGKVGKPRYFIENQRAGENPHDKLAPSMSALVITNHVKEGIEIARRHKLLPQIEAMIPEHHGTTLLRYFYNKARLLESGAKSALREGDYRYPGPIPSSRESAVVALADSIEAAARALKDPTPLKLRRLVADIINDNFIQNQLDNSRLTFSDLAKIAASFTRTLTSIHHHRITYPDSKA